MRVKKRLRRTIISLALALALIAPTMTNFSTVSAGGEEEPAVTIQALLEENNLEAQELQELELPFAVTSAADPDWAAQFESEWRAMGLTSAPAILPAPGGENAPFPYAITTPNTASRPDDESMVFVLMADGFTDSAEDQAKWRYYCQYFTRVLLNYKPFNEFKDIIKVYRIDVISNVSGVTRSDSPDGRNLPGIDPKDTYFGGYLWNRGMARLGGVSKSSAATAMANAYVPTNTSCSKNVLLNTTVYGGSGGSLAFSTLSWAFIDLVTHEMTHEAANLPDEYLSSGSSQRNNAYNSFSAYSTIVHRRWIDDPEWQAWSPWYRLLGKDGITFNAFSEALTTNVDYANVFRPSADCKMRFLGNSAVYDETGEEEFEFCEVCKEAWRDRLCQISKTPVLHFQPYNDQFYDNVPVLLNNRNFMLRIPDGDPLTPTRHCQKVYGEEINSLTPVKNVLGEFKMTVYRGNTAIPEYTDVPVNTPMNLTVGTYTVKAAFNGTYNGEAFTLELASLGNSFVVQPQTIITNVGKYAEPWNSTDMTDTLGREWRENTRVFLPELGIDPTRVGGTDASQFDITYSWHVRDFDGGVGAQIGATGTYPGTVVEGPSSVGQFVLVLHTKANATAPAAISSYDVTNLYPFDITTPFNSANHYQVDAGTYSHESVSNDFRAITIVGEGFTEGEQAKFEAAAQEFITKFLDTDPVKRMPERFCFFIENTMSADSGLTREGGTHKDTYYGFQLNADGTLGTYRLDRPMDIILFQEVWRRDTNMKTWSQWGTTVVLINEESVQSNYNWRHPESNRAVHLSTMRDGEYKRLIESVVTQFAHVRSNRDPDLLDTYRWMDGPHQNKTFEETLQRLIESCYSHEMYGSGPANLPRPVIVSDAATKLYEFDGEKVLNWDVPETFKAYSFGHELVTNTVESDTFTFKYFADDNHRVGAYLGTEAPTAIGAYWVEADLPTGAKYYLNTASDRYGFTYDAGTELQGRNGLGTANSGRVRGLARFEIVAEAPPALQLTTNAHLIEDGDAFKVYAGFNKPVVSNTATLEIVFDSALFNLDEFVPANGVTVLDSDDTADGKIFTLMIRGYDTLQYGEFHFSAKDDADLQNDDHEINLRLSYAVRLEDGTKELWTATASTIFTSTHGKDPFEPQPGEITLITLSDVIDKFGLNRYHPDWDTFRFFDKNNNGVIDIADITWVASRIKP